MKTEGWVLVGIIGLVVVALLGWSMVGLPTKPGTPGSAYPPTINGQ
jgi:ABC-type transporter Mla subunit MlaD